MIEKPGQLGASGGNGGVRDPLGGIGDRVRALRLDWIAAQPARSGRSQRLLRWAVGLAAAGAVAAFGLQLHHGSGILGAPPVVDAILVKTESSLETALDTSGYIVARSKLKVSSLVPGTVVEVHADEGQRVRKGELLARLDDTRYAAELAEARAALAAAAARLAEMEKGARPEEVGEARSRLERAKVQKRLAAANLARAKAMGTSMAPIEYDRSDAADQEAAAAVVQASLALQLVELGPREEQIAAAKADVERWKATIVKATYLVDCTRLLSPVDGLVVERSISVGENLLAEAIVAPQAFAVADFTRLTVEIDVPEQDLANVHIGQPCLITPDAYPDSRYPGVVDSFAPVLNRQRGIRLARVRFTNPDDRLTLDMNCRVQVFRGTSDQTPRDVIRIPSAAVVPQEGRSWVYVLDGEVARRRRVETAGTFGPATEICSGLREGESVLLPGSAPLLDNQPVRARLLASTVESSP